LGLRDDDELGIGVAGLNLASSGDVVVDVVAFVDVADDTDLWFVLEESIDESVQVGVPEVVVEHPDGEVEVLILRLLIPTVLTKAGEKPEIERTRVNGWRWRNATWSACLAAAMSLAVLAFVLRSRDMTGLVRPLMAAPRPFRGPKNGIRSTLTNTRWWLAPNVC
jgi:hypothetical protein